MNVIKVKGNITVNKMLTWVFMCLLLAACSSKKDILYFQNQGSYNAKKIDYSEQKIQPNDILKIEVGSLIPETAIPYNKPIVSNSPSTSLELLQLSGYKVSTANEIELPILGKISVDKMTLSELEKKIKTMLVDGNHLDKPTVTTRILNSKVTVLGEVKRPGTFNIIEPRTTIMQILGFAGDLTINGQRDDLLLIREIDGERKIIHIDLTDISVVDQPYYEIQSNDVIVVQPNYSKVKSAGFIGSPGTIVSVASLIISLTILFTN